MDEDLTAQQIGRLVLIGGLLLILLVGLIWAFNPSDEAGLRFSAEGSSAAEEDAGEPAPDPAGQEPEPPADPAEDAEPAPTEAPSPEPTETGPPAEELIAAAPDPEETTVQVLDAGGGGAAARDAADVLEELGYQVVNVTSARTDLTSTTIWFNDGAEDAAAGLQAREQRIADLAENQGLSPEVDLHLLVGSDWSET